MPRRRRYTRPSDADDEVIYDSSGEVLHDPTYERMKVLRTCGRCGRKFRGMPDHAICDSCADADERTGGY